MATAQKRSRTTWIWLITIVALIVVFYVARALTRGKLPIRVAEASVGSLTSTVATNGKVEPQINFEAHAPFPGTIRSVYIHEGQKVPAGKLLIQMNDTEAQARVAAALAALRGAQAAYQAAQQGGTAEERLTLSSDVNRAVIDRDQAQHDLEALRKLEATGAASPSEVSAAQQRLEADNNTIQSLRQRQTGRYDAADLAHAKANLDEAEVAYKAAQAALSQANVEAPFAGTVYSLPVAPTEYVQQGDRLLSMANLSRLEVRAYFDEPEIGKLHVGQSTLIVWDARPGQVWHGHIARVPSTIITYGTRNVGEVLVTIDDADGTLLPETNVRVTVTVANESNVLIVPRDALHIERGQTYVFRVEGGSLHRVSITVGNLNLTDVQVISGLKSGDEVALGTTNGQPLGDGQPVEIVQ
jgi:HlyD family secretion protein